MEILKKIRKSLSELMINTWLYAESVTSKLIVKKEPNMSKEVKASIYSVRMGLFLTVYFAFMGLFQSTGVINFEETGLGWTYFFFTLGIFSLSNWFSDRKILEKQLKIEELEEKLNKKV